MRTTLATHAEKIAAAQGVWAWYDGIRYKGPSTAAGVGSIEVERSENMLVQAVNIFQQEAESGEGWPATSGHRRKSGQRMADILNTSNSSLMVVEDEDDQLGMSWNHVPQPAEDTEVVKPEEYVDPVRSFFKVQVDDIGELVPCAVKVVKATVNSFDRSQAWPTVTAQAGRLTLVRVHDLCAILLNSQSCDRSSLKQLSSSVNHILAHMALTLTVQLEHHGHQRHAFLKPVYIFLKSVGELQGIRWP